MKRCLSPETPTGFHCDCRYALKLNRCCYCMLPLDRASDTTENPTIPDPDDFDDGSEENLE